MFIVGDIGGSNVVDIGGSNVQPAEAGTSPSHGDPQLVDQPREPLPQGLRVHLPQLHAELWAFEIGRVFFALLFHHCANEEAESSFKQGL